MKVLNVIEDTPQNKLYHIKLDNPRVARRLFIDERKPGGYVEIDHVLVGVSSLDKSDERGTFHYEETTVIGTDDTGEMYPVYVYVTQRALTLDEILWTLGELPSPTPTAETTTEED